PCYRSIFSKSKPVFQVSPISKSMTMLPGPIFSAIWLNHDSLICTRHDGCRHSAGQSEIWQNPGLKGDFPVIACGLHDGSDWPGWCGEIQPAGIAGRCQGDPARPLDRAWW